MAGFRIDKFSGMRPRISALKLPEGECQNASNTELGSGDVQPWDAASFGEDVDNTFFNKTIYRYDNAGDPVWFEFDSSDISIARGVATTADRDDNLERIYYTDAEFAKMTYRAIGTGGAYPFPSDFRKLGVPAPDVPPTVSGIEVPENIDPDLRRTTPGSIKTKLFDIVFVNYTVHPGTGTADAQWNLNSAWTGDIVFDVQIGDTFKVLEVLDDDTLTLGSATGSGAFAETAENDLTSTEYYNLFDNNGSTQEANFTGWRMPDGVEVTIPGHKLRAGDVIRVTRLDQDKGLIFPAVVGTDFFEQSWDTPANVTIDGTTFVQVPNGRVGANADATTEFPNLEGGFFYDVDRSQSVATVAEDRSYVYTYVTRIGEEGPPSPPSKIISTLDGDVVLLTGLELPPTLHYDITHMRIYRTNATVAGSAYQYVTEIPILETTSEHVLQEELGEPLSSTSYDPPPLAMQGITEMPNGMMAAFKGKTIHFCEPYFPHAWPAEYDQAVHYEIVAMASFGNSLVVLTEGVPYIITAAHPRNASARPYKINQACVAANSVAATQDMVIYASPDGLVELGANGARIVTKDYMSAKDWAAYLPETIVGEIHDGKYIGFYDGEDNVPQSPATVLLTGTVNTLGDTLTEEDVIAGSKTIILTLVSTTWAVTAGSAFDNVRQDILDGITSTTDFVTGWNQMDFNVTDVVRTSDTVVTITLSAESGYSITANETIEVIVPASAQAAAIQLPANKGFTVAAREDYSSAAMLLSTFDSGGTEMPVSVAANLDITDWDEYGNVDTVAEEQVEFQGAAFSRTLNRWLAVGFRDSGATLKANKPVFATSDDNGVTWTQRLCATPDSTTKKPRSAFWHPDYDLFIVSGDGFIQTSPDGINWKAGTFDSTVGQTQSIRDLVIANGSENQYVYGGCLTQDFLLRSPNLEAKPAHYTWKKSTTSYATATGTKHMCSGNGRIIHVGNYDTDMDLNYTIHGQLASNNIGAVATYNCTGIVFGADLFVAVSNDFRIVTCVNGIEATIGNWSSPSSSKAANVTIDGIIFDEGDTTTQGFGFIAYGINTSSGKGVIYTSPDASTWTLRHTAAADVKLTAAAVKWPETSLGVALTDFSPTYNGSQAPTVVGTAIGAGQHQDFTRQLFSSAFAWQQVIVKVTGSNATIRHYGSAGGGPTQITATPGTATNPIFTLGLVPDSVRITLKNLTKVGSTPNDSGIASDGTDSGGAHPVNARFTDGQFFEPILNEEYSYIVKGWATASTDASTDGSVGRSFREGTIQFTFRKLGYNDLTVEYAVAGQATATATDIR